MNHEEQRLLTEFLDQLRQVRGISKDPAADDLIQQAGREQPDALYLLVQRTLLQDQALQSAKARIDQLQQQLQSIRSRQAGSGPGSFLSRDPWATAAPAVPRDTHAPAAPPYGVPPAAPAGGSWQTGGFLGSIATTAAGVAGGALLFQGLESLMGHHHHGYGDPGYGDDRPDQITINEYYGDSHPPAGTDTLAGTHFGNNDFITGEDDWDSYDNDVDSVDA